jgi:TolB-like protein
MLSLIFALAATAASDSAAKSAPAPATPPVAVQRLAVLKIIAQGAAPGDVADTLTSVVAEQASKTPGFNAISQAEIAALLGVEKQKQMLGCGNSSCLAEIGGALGAKLVLSGSLGKVGESYVFQLQLLDTSKGQVKARESKTVNPTSPQAHDAQSQLPDVARDLVTFVLTGKHLDTTGKLKLAITPDTAKVVVDGVTVGLAPLPAPLKLAEGAHTLHIEADGYLPIDAAVDVVAGQTLFNSFDLISVEPIAQGGRHTTSRVVGLTLLGLGAAALGVGIGTGIEAQTNYNNYSANPYKYGYDNPVTNSYTPGATDYKNTTTGWAWAANGAFAGAILLGATGTAFLIYSFQSTPTKRVQLSP